MTKKLWGRWLVMGAAVSALSACEDGSSKLAEFRDLADRAWQQVYAEVGGGPPVDPLLTAPVEERALAGVQIAAVEPEPVSLEEMLATQSFFVVGSVIAKPRVEIVEAVVEDEELDALPEVTAQSLEISAEDDVVDVADDAPAIESVVIEEPVIVEEAAPARSEGVGAPERLEMRVPAPVVAAPSNPPPPPQRRTIARAPQTSAGAPPAPSVKSVDANEMRRRVQMAPKSLENAVTKSGARVTEDSLKVARRIAKERVEAKTKSDRAQQMGDEIVRRSKDADAPLPKALAVRTRLKVTEAVTARERAQSKLEELGLSGVVTPEEGGQMKIVIGVSPTKFLDGKAIDPTTVDAMRSRFALRKERPEEECTGNPSQQQMQDDPILATECVVKILQETGDYEYVEKDFVFTPQLLRRPKSDPTQTAAVSTPNDPLYGLQWHFKDNGVGEDQSAGGAGFADFWKRAEAKGSRSVTVAVVDTGIQMSHPDIAGSPNLAPGYDMVSDPVMGNDGDGRDADPNDPGDRCDPNDPTSSDTFHGTHVAGTIGVAATNNASGVAGGAWDVTIVPVRALGRCGGRLSDINDGIRWAAGAVAARDEFGEEVWNDNPADIINLSVGLFQPCPASMQAAIDDAVAAGAIVVSAAGNARIDTKYFAPGGCRNVISVAASDARGMLTPYSNFGEDVDIMAPGGDMSRDDDGDGRPDGVLSTKFSTDCYDPAQPETKLEECFYAYENGTSMAAPHVSAALALLKTRYPTAVPSDLTAKLLQATSERGPAYCSGTCAAYPGTTAIPDQEGMCYRPCGGAMLDLAKASLE